MNHLPKTLLTVKDNHSVIAESKIQLEETKKSHFYMYDVTNHLIEQTGRFCEHYHSDLLVLLDSVMESMREDEDGIYCFGIRQNGVDGNSYIFNRMKDRKMLGMNDYYRKVYAIEFHRHKDVCGTHILVQLKDVSTALSYDKDDDDYDVSQINTKIA